MNIRLLSVIWMLFLSYRVLLSGSVDLFIELGSANLILGKSFYTKPYFIELIRIIGFVSALLVLIKKTSKYAYLFFSFSILYFSYLMLLTTGSCGIWAFYFIPLISISIGFLLDTKQEIIHKVLVIAYSLFYFAAGFAKFYPITKSVSWLNSYTLHNLLLTRQNESVLYSVFNINIFDLDPLIFKMGIFFSVILELSAIIIIFKLNFSKFFVPAILLFHAFLFITGTPGIIEYSFAA
jgi:hypothetical protein